MGGRISRNRGYNFEHNLIKFVNEQPDWYARRLGGSSASMPDLLLVNNNRQTIRVSECKSLMTENKKSMLYIPQDQIQRCIDFSEIFKLYTTREVIFSFKFGRGYGNSYFFVLNRQYYNNNILFARCSYSGECIIKTSDNTKWYLESRESLIS